MPEFEYNYHYTSNDEFRYWKALRNSEQIGTNWFDQVGGGTNSDIHNTELGIYYKFNEGITQTASVDRIVLDYSGRVSNGAWTGYTTKSRNTGSAIISASLHFENATDPETKEKQISIETNSGISHNKIQET